MPEPQASASHLYYLATKVGKKKWKMPPKGGPGSSKEGKPKENLAPKNYALLKRSFAASQELARQKYEQRYSLEKIREREVIGIQAIVYVQIIFFTAVGPSSTIFTRYGLEPVYNDSHTHTWIVGTTTESFLRLISDIHTFAKSPGDGLPTGTEKILSIIYRFNVIGNEERLPEGWDYLGAEKVTLEPFSLTDTKPIEKAIKSIAPNAVYKREKSTVSIQSSSLQLPQLQKIIELADNINLASTTHIIPSTSPIGNPTYQKGEIKIDFSNVPEEVVCVVDSGVQANKQLARLLESGLSKSLVNESPLEDKAKKGHGTIVAGIVIFGDQFIDHAKQLRPFAKVCSLQVVNEFDEKSSFNYADLIRAIEEVHLKSGGKVRIFNLSIGFNCLPDNIAVSPIGFALDRLCHKREIICVISAGNYREASSHAYPTAWHYQTSNLLTPAESINSISVGSQHWHGDSTHRHAAFYSRKDNIDSGHLYYDQKLHRKKPDLVTFGGDGTARQVLGLHPSGQVVACSGTSFAAPYITHILALLSQKYPQLGVDALKALLLNKIPPLDEGVRDFCYRHGLQADRIYGNGALHSDDAGNILISTQDDVTIIFEGEIDFATVNPVWSQSIFTNLQLPKIIGRKSRKDHGISIKATMCYRPFVNFSHSLWDYNPCHLSFRLHAGTDTHNDTLTFLNGKLAWSQKEEDTKAWSNVQQVCVESGLTPAAFNKLINEGLQLTVRGRLKKFAFSKDARNEEILKHYRTTPQKFALAITLRDLGNSGNLLDDIRAMGQCVNADSIKAKAILRT